MSIQLIERILIEEKVHSIGFYADSFLKKFNMIVPNIGHSERGYLNTENFPDLRNIITLGSVKNRGIFTTRELMLLGMHMDDIEMENALVNIKPKDPFLKRISFKDKNEKKVELISHEEILNTNHTFSALQNFLINSI